MMKLFKNIDDKFKEIGFIKVKENSSFVSYERHNKKFNYVQCLDLGVRFNGYHLIQSYQKDINTDKFNNVVGLTMYETKLALKKMKQKGFK